MLRFVVAAPMRTPRRRRPRQQALRRAARAEGHHDHGRPRRGRRGDRPERLGQVDALPRDQPARDHRRRHHHDRRQVAARGGRGAREAARRRRHGVPVASTSSRTRRCSRTSPSRRSRCASCSKAEAEKRAMELLDRVGVANQAHEDAGPALGRPAAARRHRPRPRDGPEGDAPRRADLRARPRDDQRGARRHGRPREGRHDHDRRHPRDGLRPQGRRPRRVHGRRPDRRGGRRPSSSSTTRRVRPRAGLPLEDPRPTDARAPRSRRAACVDPAARTRHEDDARLTQDDHGRLARGRSDRRCVASAGRAGGARLVGRHDRRRREPADADVRGPDSTTMARLAEAGKITIGTKFDQPLFGLVGPRRHARRASTSRSASSSPPSSASPPDKINWTETVSANREPFIQNGEVDLVVATYTINDKRKEVVSSPGPYYAGRPGRSWCSRATPTHQERRRPRGQAGLLRHRLDPAPRTSPSTYGADRHRRPTPTRNCLEPLRTGQVVGGHDRQRDPRRPRRPERGRVQGRRRALHRGALRHRPRQGRHRVPQVHQRHARRRPYDDGTWDAAVGGDGRHGPRPRRARRRSTATSTPGVHRVATCARCPPPLLPATSPT